MRNRIGIHKRSSVCEIDGNRIFAAVFCYRDCLIGPRVIQIIVHPISLDSQILSVIVFCRTVFSGIAFIFPCFFDGDGAENRIVGHDASLTGLIGDLRCFIYNKFSARFHLNRDFAPHIVHVKGAAVGEFQRAAILYDEHRVSGVISGDSQRRCVKFQRPGNHVCTISVHKIDR